MARKKKEEIERLLSDINSKILSYYAIHWTQPEWIYRFTKLADEVTEEDYQSYRMRGCNMTRRMIFPYDKRKQYDTLLKKNSKKISK